MYLKNTPMVKLMTGARLTSLEIFQAIDPTHEAPAEIVAAHAGEALALGRPNSDVVKAVFDRNAPIEKSSAGCDAWVFAAPSSDPCEYWGKRLGIDSAYGYPTTNLPVGNSTSDFSYQTLSTVALGACNDTNNDEYDQFITQVDSTGPWINSSWYTIAPWTGNRHWINVSYVTYGAGCGLGCLHAGAYRVHGWGSNVHLRSAEESYDGSCIH